MTREKAMDLFESLSYSQGSYGRLVNAIRYAEENDPESADNWFDELEKNTSDDPLSVILWIEL